MRIMLILCMFNLIVSSLVAEDSINDVLNKMNDLHHKYSDSSRSNTIIKEIRDCITEWDKIYGNNYDYLLQKAKLILTIGTFQEYNVIMNLIPDTALQDPIDLINRLNGYDPANMKKSLPILEKLADKKPELLKMWVMNSFCQNFSTYVNGNPELRFTRAKEFLDYAMNNVNESVKIYLADIYLWTEIVIHRQDTPWIKNVLRNQKKDIQKMDYRFKLLTAITLGFNSELNKTSVEMIHSFQKEIQIQLKDSSQKLNEKNKNRVLFFNSYCYYLQAKNALSNNDQKNALNKFIKSANELLSITEKGDIFYDSFYFYDARDFSNEYIDFVTKYCQPDDAVKYLGDYVTFDLDYFDDFVRYYVKSGIKKPIQDIWSDVIIKRYPEAPVFSLEGFDGSVYSSQQYTGKWLLIDFWGTWCTPCVEGLPEIEAYYRDIIKNQNALISLLTVDCFDDSVKTTEFLSNHKYSFPVTKGTDVIIKSFRVNRYPTKILITPSGRMITLNSKHNLSQEIAIYMMTNIEEYIKNISEDPSTAIPITK